MAKKKAEPLPFFAVKHDFIDSLEEFIQRAINLNSMASAALDLNQVSEPMATKLREAQQAFERAALTRD